MVLSVNFGCKVTKKKRYHQIFCKKNEKKHKLWLSLHFALCTLHFFYYLCNMKSFFCRNMLFYACYAVVFLAMVMAIVWVPKVPLHLAMNAFHTPFLDRFMFFVSTLAEWPLYVLMLLPLLKRTWRPLTALFACSELISVGLVQLLKHVFDMPRPVEVIGLDNLPPLCILHSPLCPLPSALCTFTYRHWYSFPSGHTATFFVFATILYLWLSTSASRTSSPSSASSPGTPQRSLPLLGKGCLQGGIGVFAFLGGYSRIYLSQHFLLDVCFGSLIGLLSATFVFYLYERYATLRSN